MKIIRIVIPFSTDGESKIQVKKLFSESKIKVQKLFTNYDENKLWQKIAELLIG